ncbi:MAG: cell division protein FtsY [Myxococcaceae bacterium]|nr:cell division protein FtsY [Myxococcaceae bacterium]MEA2747523.1 hypothetical protein [Myxococcales bacterium]
MKNLHERRAAARPAPEPRTPSIPILAEDRRRHPRYALSLSITMQGENNFYAGLSEDISEGGVFIATYHLLPIETPVVLSFTLPTSDEPLSVFGTVAWVRGPDATARSEDMFGAGRELPGVMPGIGVRFHGLDAATRQTIRDFMQRRSPVFFDA